MNTLSQATFGSESDYAFVAQTTNVKHLSLSELVCCLFLAALTSTDAVRTIRSINFGDVGLHSYLTVCQP
jgi:hypothetical protein